MKTNLLFISLLSLTVSFGQSGFKVERSIKILDCEGGFIYHYAGNKVVLEGTWLVPSDTSKIWFTKTVDKTTSDAFNKVIDAFEKLDNKLFYYNNCTNDGFNFKIYIQNKDSVQKIFVSNYYDALVDSLTSIFQEQLIDFKSDFNPGIGYGKNREYIEGLIKSQKACNDVPTDFKNYLLDKWCELEENE